MRVQYYDANHKEIIRSFVLDDFGHELRMKSAYFPGDDYHSQWFDEIEINGDTMEHLFRAYGE